MKKICLLFCLFPLVFLPSAGTLAQVPERDERSPAAEGDAPEATDFIRIDENDKAARLQTSVTTYQKGAVTVDLIGAVHIADKKYYEHLNDSFKKYDVLLFEMVGGEQMVDGAFPGQQEARGDIQASFLRGMVDGMSRFLKLSSQVQEIDYSPKNFVHADLTMKQFEKRQKEKGESLFGFALAAAQQAQNEGVEQPNPARLIAALLSGNSDGLKLEMMKSLGQGDDQIAALAGNNVIIGDRNAKCIRVLRKQLQKGKKRVGIFYGAAHNPDLEDRLLKMEYQKGKQHWITAWDVSKPERQQKNPHGKKGGDEKAAPSEASQG
ncbi:MAG: hypothetical protein CMO40_02295 [Verrucomicrobiaceae bacterium]|nr:hypothetical protein [Verrucomicrobiaceae bacterium]